MLINKPYEWISHITQHKTPIEKFDDADWKLFVPVYINKALSSNPALLEFIDQIQTFNQYTPQQLYLIYKEYIPVDKQFYRYTTKSAVQEVNQKIIETLAIYFESSLGEAKENYYLLPKEETERILSMYGISEEDLNEKTDTKNNKGNKRKKTK